MLLRRLAALMLLVPACSYPRLAPLDLEPPPDAPPDGPEICIGRFVVVCGPASSSDLVFAAPETINTDIDSRCALQDQKPGEPQLCVIAGNDIHVNVRISAIGSHPLVLAAFHDLNINQSGSLVLTSPHDGSSGAGANDPACKFPGPGGDGDVNVGGGGGGGGSFGGQGGIGGDPSGVASNPIVPLVRVTGGCKGSPGGTDGSAFGGLPGSGGGAVMLIAANTLTIAGDVTAGGGGGLPAPNHAGGGGGGSGGFVGLDAMKYSISGTGRVTANGGGGGAGGGGSILGLPGDDGNPLKEAAGGNAAGGGGDGGYGSFSSIRDGRRGDAAPYGGGGGGGGAGVILVKGVVSVGGVLSPPPTYVP